MEQDIKQRIDALQEKYSATGQDMLSYLDGLIYSDYLSYWDYVHLDTLLSLQSPRTPFPDEEIFIMYHQITELYFKLSLHELQQIAEKENISKAEFLMRLKRVVRYFDVLSASFDVMTDGMEQEQFLKFRMALLPASGFQSAQYRMIEIACTTLINLVDKDFREQLKNSTSTEELMHHIYWKKGATELKSGNKTYTLIQFEKKYFKKLVEHADFFKDKNVLSKYYGLSDTDKNDAELIDILKKLDTHVNVNWPLSHFRTAVRYLHKNPEDIAATGGTNWQKYLPPRFQRRIFYPEFYSTDELENWGKNKVH